MHLVCEDGFSPALAAQHLLKLRCIELVLRGRRTALPADPLGRHGREQPRALTPILARRLADGPADLKGEHRTK